ncbi:HAD superfamily hydrolase (TIGR01484 family) [Evansella vedderi]|uniref:HAD superfamily hydrolase (TIGR01484 family) n=1 Tax=Evansella vedderi TaxID=38282 RepID=A0ABU0A0E3_9BACI|nr:Cof-type HAD-IIB family hydrolase [Evansella vedderi]MDQ0256950.1 HAD superfamily hydrolase (TIGR01484 family) [Evansella vedderi]
MEQDIKLIALDMDGTLLKDNHEVSPANRKAIKVAKEQGIHIVLSTGRSILSCKEYADSLELDSYLVTVNGSEIWDTQGNLIDQNPIDAELIEMLWDLKMKHNTQYWAISSEKVWRDDFPTDIQSQNWLKFGFHFEDAKIQKEVTELLTKHEALEVSNSSPTNLEINAAGINKGFALEKVCNWLDITMDNVMAVGDSLNDIVMIKEAGVGVAMGNAQQKVKDAANWVTSSNNDDGVARAIEKFILDKSKAVE